MKRSTFFLLSLIGLASCNTISYLGIETYNPAEITFPDRTERILIVNNAVPQPEQSGYAYSYLGTDQDTCRAKADSALVYACRSLGKAILEGEYFSDVLLYNAPLRTDNDFLVDQKLTPDRVAQLCRETGTDAVLSLDRLLFSMQKKIWNNADRSLSAEIKVEMKGVVRTYLPGRAAPLATVHMNDSVFWSEEGMDMEVLNMFLPLPDDALSIGGVHFGNNVYPNFVPHWQNETRWYYTAMSASWKEATAYAKAGKWEEAASRWRSIHDNTGKWEAKARSASNLALAYEMAGEFAEALQWAEKAQVLWEKNAGEDDRDRRLNTAYVQALAERLKSNMKLDQQIGIE